MVELHTRLNPNRPKFLSKFTRISWGLVVLTILLAGIGFAMLYSAAGGDVKPWAERHLIRFIFGLFLVFVVSLVDIRFWMKSAYFFYAAVLVALVLVEVYGLIGMGAQRWLHLGWIQIQPSEIMKIALILALASYFHGRTIDELKQIRYMLTPLVMVIVPMFLVLRQPDLGTAIMLGLGGAAVFFVAGTALRYFVVGIGMLLAGVPTAWQFLETYQKNRILTFLNPDADPLGAGYHIIQSKIALGSGGLVGRGYMQGTQSHLSFLPEHQTDFIFTMLAEEFGMAGALVLIGLYTAVFMYGLVISARCSNHFGRLLAAGLTTTLFLYVYINIAMVIGIIPVVGVPLPLISYGGSAMMTVLFALGLLMCVFVHRDTQIGRLKTHDS
ncbi:MAG: rod shape-determining protein RodA [Pseudomonadota bacterium]|nr:rod shape-determining protein RodA [Pseudomonadota bacterium]